MQCRKQALVEILDILAEYGGWIIANNDKAGPTADNDQGRQLANEVSPPRSITLIPDDHRGENDSE